MGLRTPLGILAISLFAELAPPVEASVFTSTLRPFTRSYHEGNRIQELRIFQHLSEAEATAVVDWTRGSTARIYNPHAFISKDYRLAETIRRVQRNEKFRDKAFAKMERLSAKEALENAKPWSFRTGDIYVGSTPEGSDVFHRVRNGRHHLYIHGAPGSTGFISFAFNDATVTSILLKGPAGWGPKGQGRRLRAMLAQLTPGHSQSGFFAWSNAAALQRVKSHQSVANEDWMQVPTFESLGRSGRRIQFVEGGQFGEYISPAVPGAGPATMMEYLDKASFQWDSDFVESFVVQ